jgi:hypothetical protein
MSVSLHEHRLGGLRWILLNGPDREAFGALGEHVREELAALAESWPVLPRLRRHVSGPPGRDLLAAARQATAESFPAEWAELAAFAAGAGVPSDDLVLLNLRGDLGLGWRRERSVVAHNEDGALEDVGRCALLTMTGTGRPSVTAFWYPGFVPANAFALTGDGLIWTVDHLPVAAPGPGAGRHFVGRGLQRSARTVDDAIAYLRSRPSAGGFSYTVGDRAGRVVNVEAAAGRHAVSEAGPGLGPLLWHTNHGRYLSGAEPEAGGTSAARGETLDALGVPAEDPGPSWFLDVLTSPPPGGVRSDPGPDGRGLTTLCTLVADLTAGEAVIAARGEPPVAIPLADLSEGHPSRPVQF